MSGHPKFEKRWRFWNDPDTAEIAFRRRHPARHRPGTSRTGLDVETLALRWCTTCFRWPDVIRSEWDPRLDWWELREEDTRPREYRFSAESVWDPHEEGHREFIIKLRYVRRQGRHIDKGDLLERLGVAAAIIEERLDPGDCADRLNPKRKLPWMQGGLNAWSTGDH